MAVPLPTSLLLENSPSHLRRVVKGFRVCAPESAPTHLEKSPTQFSTPHSPIRSLYPSSPNRNASHAKRPALSIGTAGSCISIAQLMQACVNPHFPTCLRLAHGKVFFTPTFCAGDKLSETRNTLHTRKGLDSKHGPGSGCRLPRAGM
jgi:hypothetical protein